MIEENRREDKRAEFVKKCIQCQAEYASKNPLDEGLVFLRNRCTTCDIGLKLKQLDPPQQRGKVGGYQPW